RRPASRRSDAWPASGKERDAPMFAQAGAGVKGWGQTKRPGAVSDRPRLRRNSGSLVCDPREDGGLRLVAVEPDREVVPFAVAIEDERVGPATGRMGEATLAAVV